MGGTYQKLGGEANGVLSTRINALVVHYCITNLYGKRFSKNVSNNGVFEYCWLPTTDGILYNL